MSKREQASKDTGSAKTAKQQPSSSFNAQETPSLLQRAQTTPSTLTAHDVKHLQRAIGNRATVDLLSRATPIQAQLTLGPADDAYEREADQVADQVVRQIDSNAVQRQDEEDELQMKSLSVQRQGEEDELQMKRAEPVRQSFVVRRQPGDEEEIVQGRYEHGPEGGEVDPSITSQIQAARGGGRPLDDGVRGGMESGFGTDFGGVRVHTDSHADTLNRALNARAFTVGSDIFFKGGEYNPGNSGGKQLLAHELTHTIQQGAVQAKRSFEKPTISADLKVEPNSGKRNRKH
ncbi:MAG: DUF4157 domain-containing protein [Caldilineaceae bacterium]